jgi:hypothetical protein
MALFEAAQSEQVRLKALELLDRLDERERSRAESLMR